MTGGSIVSIVIWTTGCTVFVELSHNLINLSSLHAVSAGFADIIKTGSRCSVNIIDLSVVLYRYESKLASSHCMVVGE